MPPDRFRVAAALPTDGGWRCELALDRETTPPRAVALARVPASVSGDALALASLARGVDLAGRLEHPSLLPVLGLVEVGGGLAVVSPFREGETLRAVLDGGGPLTPALASRVVGDVARAVQAAHGLAAAGLRCLAHGAIRPETVRIAEDGAVLLTGLGRPVDPQAVVADDLEALIRLLGESLAPGGGGAVPPELAALTGRSPGGDLPRTVADFADALAAAVPPAAPGALMARVDSAIPKGAAARASRRRALAQAQLAEAGGEAQPTLTPSPSGPTLTAPPALSPPPFRTPLATPIAATMATPLAAPVRPLGGQAATPSADAAPARAAFGPPPLASRAPVAMATSGPVLASAPPGVSPVLPGAEAAAPQPGLLEDPRRLARLALVLALGGLVLGFLLGRR